ncbi:MAG: hypothetical protein V2A79_03690, partial [Planctomycetota bacterium]
MKATLALCVLAIAAMGAAMLNPSPQSTDGRAPDGDLIVGTQIWNTAPEEDGADEDQEKGPSSLDSVQTSDHGAAHEEAVQEKQALIEALQEGWSPEAEVPTESYEGPAEDTGDDFNRYDPADCYEDFEGTFPGSYWFVGDTNSSSGSDYWDDVSCKYYEGGWSGWCAGNGSQTDCTTYDNSMDAYMYVEADYYGSTINGRNKLYYKRWGLVEDCCDYWYHRIEGYINEPTHGMGSGTPDAVYESEHFGDTTGWASGTITLGSTFDPCYYVREIFRFHSDSSVTDQGVYMDYIEFCNRSDTDIHPISGGFTGSGGYGTTITSCTITPNPATCGQAVALSAAGQVHGASSGDLIKLTIGFRDGSGHWVGGDPVIVYSSVPGQSWQSWSGSASVAAPS